MKILLVAEKYPPIVGGGETHLHQLAEGMAERGNDVTVLTEAVAANPEKTLYRSGKVKVREIIGLAAACQRLECKEALECLHAEFARTDADIVHVFNYIPALLTSWLRPAVTANLVVSLFETLVPGVRVFDMWANWELELSLQRGLVDNLRPDLHLCGSKAYLRWLREAGFSEPAAIVEFGTDLTAFTRDSSSRARWRAAHDFTDELLFLVPARPVPRKRIEDAITALAAVREEHPQVRVVLTAPTDRSNSQYVAMLRALSAELGVDDSICWVDNLSWQDMPTLYSAADAVILPSSHEGWGIALNEAMAGRCPVITSDVEGHDEVISHGRTGLLYPAGDTGALAAAMRRVATTDLSEMVERAHQEAQRRFSVDRVVDGHLSAYQPLLSAAPTGAPLPRRGR